MTRRDVPNLLTALRFALALATFGGLLTAAFGAGLFRSLDTAAVWIFASLAAFVVGAGTDFFDGWLARRWNATSLWGAVLDPIADKVAVCAAVIGLVAVERRLAVAAAGGLILFREVFVAGLREAGAARGVTLPVTLLAKWKTTLQLVALSLEMAAAGLLVHELATHGRAAAASTRLFMVADAALWIAALATVWTGAQYAAGARAGLKPGR